MSTSDSDLVVQRSMHLCQIQPNNDFQEKFKARYDAQDALLFDSPFLRFDVDDELDAANKAREFVAEVCQPFSIPTSSTPSYNREESQINTAN